MSGVRANKGIEIQRTGSRLAGKLTLAAALSTGLGLAVATPQAWSQAAQTSGRSDSQIQSDVTYALANSGALKGQQITAATVEGDVTISGNVRDDASKELAESLIYRVNSVRSVTNNLTVGGAAQQPAQGQVAGADNTVQSVDPNQAQAQQDPNYDPAQQNMAPVDPNQAQTQDPSQQQSGPMPPPSDPNYPPSQPQYGQQPQPDQQAQYGRQPYNQQPSYSQQPTAPVAIPAGTLLQVRTSEPLDATHLQPGQLFTATVAADVYQGSVLALPRGAVVTGKVLTTQSNKGDLAGKQGLTLGLTNVNLSGQIFPLSTDAWAGQGPGKGGYSAANTVGTAGLGAIIGAIAGGGAGAAIGAGAGAIVGAGASAATTGPRLYIPAEAVLNFHLVAPALVNPVSPQEAQRLASNTYPQVQRRGAYPYPYGGYPPRPYAAYPPPPPPGYYYNPYRYPVAYPYYYYRY